MLWYKAWRESRARFLLAAGAIVLYSAGVLASARSSFPPPEVPQLPYSAFVWAEFYGNGRAAAFAIIALVLALGGLQRERAAGTATFTLVLPVSRGQLVRARLLVGVIELTALAILPAVLVPALSPVLAGHPYPWSQSASYAALFLSWGVVWFVAGFVWSTLFAGEFTAVVAAVLTPFAYMTAYGAVSRGGRRFFAANPFAMMTGGLDHGLGGRMLLTRPLPWLEMLVLAGVAATLALAAWRITVRQNF